jgi:ADP-ribose pyrophosphatase YjhB (NUDIX family)
MPSVGVFAAVFDDEGRILCIKREYGVKNWALPGGKMDEPHESPPAAAEREVREESGYRVRATELIGMYATPEQDDIVLLFATEVVGRDEWQPDSEISRAEFFPADDLPQPLSDHAAVWIRDARAGARGVVRVLDRHPG